MVQAVCRAHLDLFLRSLCIAACPAVSRNVFLKPVKSEVELSSPSTKKVKSSVNFIDKDQMCTKGARFQRKDLDGPQIELVCRSRTHVY